MTDREKLIEMIENAEYLCDSRECGEDGCEYSNYPNCWAQFIANHLIANGVTFATDNNVGGKWIPVTERLPQEDEPTGALCETVQVLLSDGTVTVGWCNREVKRWYFLPFDATRFTENVFGETPVVAWQPLSTPPADMRKGEK